MDGENNGKPYEQMDDLGVPSCGKHPYVVTARIFGRNFRCYVPQLQEIVRANQVSPFFPLGEVGRRRDLRRQF